MERKTLLMLSFITTVIIAVVAGKKVYESRVSEKDILLMQNVEALTNGENDSWFKVKYRNTADCDYVLFTGVNGKAKLSIVGIGTMELKAGTDGYVRYTISKGEVLCEGTGEVLCQPRNCPIAFWE